MVVNDKQCNVTLLVGNVYAICELGVQIAMSEHLKTLEVYHVSTIPKQRLLLPSLAAASNDLQDAEALFQELRSSLRRPLPF